MRIISTPTELITAVPFLLDGQPENALVFIALRDGAVLSAHCAQIPEAKEFDGGEELFADLRASAPEQLLLLAYLPARYEQERSEQLCSEVQELAQKIAPVKDFLVIQRGRWRSFLCRDESCCDQRGQELPDIQSSAIAAERVFQGFLMPTISRPEVPLLNQDGTISLALLASTEREFACSEPALRSKRGVVTLLRLISAFTISKSIDDLRLAAEALIAFTDIHVRDFAIGSHGDENLLLHLSLWQELLDVAPQGYRAPVATVLSLLRYEDGDSEGARATLELALCDDPHYSLAHLLQKTFAAGWPPEAFTTMRHELHPKLRAELLG